LVRIAAHRHCRRVLQLLPTIKMFPGQLRQNLFLDGWSVENNHNPVHGALRFGILGLVRKSVVDYGMNDGWDMLIELPSGEGIAVCLEGREKLRFDAVLGRYAGQLPGSESHCDVRRIRPQALQQCSYFWRRGQVLPRFLLGAKAQQSRSRAAACLPDVDVFDEGRNSDPPPPF